MHLTNLISRLQGRLREAATVEPKEEQLLQLHIGTVRSQ